MKPTNICDHNEDVIRAMKGFTYFRCSDRLTRNLTRLILETLENDSYDLIEKDLPLDLIRLFDFLEVLARYEATPYAQQNE